jgi:hypothetical protein
MVAYLVEHPARYTAQLQAGLGLIPETQVLLQLWEQGMSAPDLYRRALESGHFPMMTARRLRNLVVEGFAARYLREGDAPARYMKILLPTLTSAELQQLCLLLTCRSQSIVRDFIHQVYWVRYAAGDRELLNETARLFIERAIDHGRMIKPWSEETIGRIAGSLTGCCADYGLLESGARRKRRFLNIRLLDKIAVYLAYDLHFQGLSDQTLLHHEDWQIFGLEASDVLAELKRLSLEQWFIVQSGGQLVRIGWKYKSMEALCHVLSGR